MTAGPRRSAPILLGLADTFMPRGHETYSMDYHFPGKDETPRLDFRALDSLASPRADARP